MDDESKKMAMKDIILNLHRGLSAEDAKLRFEREVGSISSTEIAAIEQSLIDEGLSPDEIKRFCNVHALIFQSALEKLTKQETSPSHPVYLFKAENREIEKLTAQLANETGSGGVESAKKILLDIMHRLGGLTTHYERKEQLLFPFLEKQGFMGPSAVMWGKDNEIRSMLKAAYDALRALNTDADISAYVETIINPLVAEINGMVFKEENILFPAALEKLSAADWAEILKESDDVGYVFIEKPQETGRLAQELRNAMVEEAVPRASSFSFPTGELASRELLAVLNTLPVDITFVDKDDTVKYFSDSKDRVFRRTKAIIGRQVQNCHPPQSIDVVNKILASFKEGRNEPYEFWIGLQGRFVHIRYFPVRDAGGAYLGTMEVTQDVTAIRELQGQKRLIDERG